MTIILFVAGIVTYDKVAKLLENSAETRIQQTAVQANGRLDALLQQMDMLTAQVATNSYLQKLLVAELDGKKANFDQRQSLQQVAESYQAYVTGIQSLELYTTDNRRLFPLDENRLENRVARNWIDSADMAKGGLVWIGPDPNDRGSVLAIRRVSLMERWYSHGGYIVARIQRSYFDFNEPGANQSGNILLTDRAGHPIVSDFGDAAAASELLGQEGRAVDSSGEEYLVVKQHSESSGWTLSIFTPVSEITDGISVLRTAILASGLIGALLFLIMSFTLSTMITRPIFKLIKAMRGARLGVLRPNPMVSSTMEINELNNTYNQMVDHMNELIKVVYEKEMLQSRTELKALQAQINPHFLFNTLEAFYWSLDEKGEDELAGLVVAMSGLFRYIISNPNRDEWVTVGEELEHVERYLQIMKMRLGDRLTWNIVTTQEHNVVKLPKLLVQPLVENAILHGVENKIGEGAVSVSIQPSEQPGYIRIAIKDDGPGMDEETLQELRRAMEGGPTISSKGTGIGIVNVQRRLKLYFDAEADKASGLRIDSRSGSGTTVSFEIPSESEGAV